MARPSDQGWSGGSWPLLVLHHLLFVPGWFDIRSDYPCRWGIPAPPSVAPQPGNISLSCVVFSQGAGWWLGTHQADSLYPCLCNPGDITPVLICGLALLVAGGGCWARWREGLPGQALPQGRREPPSPPSHTTHLPHLPLSLSITGPSLPGARIAILSFMAYKFTDITVST